MEADEPDLRPAAGYPCRVLLTDAAEGATDGRVATEIHLPRKPYRGLLVQHLDPDDPVDLVVSAACLIGTDRYLITLDVRQTATA